MYRFEEQLREGQSGEEVLDAFFSGRYDVFPVGEDLQRRGIDRFFEDRATGEVFSVEYKTDFLAHKTGNAFVETVSVDSSGKPGWARSSQASFLVYYIPGLSRAYLFRMDALREKLPDWVFRFPVRSAENQGYRTHGVLVPLEEIGRCAVAVFELA